MKDLADWLKETDPVTAEPGLSDEDITRIRQAMRAATAPKRPAIFWRPLILAAAAVLALLAPLVATKRPPAPPAIASLPETPPPESTTRQLQFATRGGTRVIWVFNSDFQQ
jgi:hypothetical protein